MIRLLPIHNPPVGYIEDEHRVHSPGLRRNVGDVGEVIDARLAQQPLHLVTGNRAEPFR